MLPCTIRTRHRTTGRLCVALLPYDSRCWSLEETEHKHLNSSHMATPGGPSSSNSDGGSHDSTPVPDSSRHTSHTGKQSRLGGLGYGVCVAWHHLRPFIPFFLISFMVVALVYLMQAIIYGGPFKDPLFFVKFNERWPRPAPVQQDSPAPTEVFSKVPSSSLKQILFELHRDNETMWADWSLLLCPVDLSYEDSSGVTPRLSANKRTETLTM